MEIIEDDLLKIAFAAYGNSPVRAELSIATWRHVDGWSSLNYCGSDKEIFAICINGVAPAFSTNDTLRSIGIAYGVSPTFSTKSPLIFFCFPQTI